MADERKRRNRDAVENELAPPSEDELAILNADMDMSEEPPPTEEELSMLNNLSALLGPFYKGLGLGDYRAEIAGAIDSPTGALKALLGQEDPDVREYVSARDQASKAMASAEQAKPAVSTLGSLLGMIVGAGAGGMIAGGARTGLGAIARGAGTGMALGAAANPQNVEGEVGGIQAQERLLGQGLPASIVGGTLAAPAASVVPFLKKSEERLLKSAEDLAEEQLRKDVVEKAAKDLDVPLAPGMAVSDKAVRGVADTLRQSPTFAGRSVQKAYDETFGKMQKAAGKIFSDRLEMDAVDVGDSVKNQLRKYFTDRYKPVREMYERAGADLSKIGFDGRVKTATLSGIMRRFKNNPNIGDPAANPRARAYLEQIDAATTLERVRLLQSDAKALLRSPDPADKALGMEIVDSLDGAIQRQVTRKAIEATGRDATGRKLAQMTLDDIKGANREYRSMVQLIQNVAKRGKMGSSIRTYGDMMKALSDDIDGIKSEDIGRNLFNTNDRALMETVRTQFPNAFETMRKARIGDIMDKSRRRVQGELTEEIDFNELFRQLDRLPEHAFQTLFPSQGGKIEALRALKLSVPQKIGPSGTPQGNRFIDYLSAAQQVPMEAMDKMALRAVEKGQMPNLSAEKFASGVGRMGGAAGGMAASALGGGFQTQETLEGYPLSMLRPIPVDLVPETLMRVHQNSRLSTIQRAKITNLINKHGLLPPGVE